MIADFGLVTIMLYGFFIRDKKNDRAENLIRFATLFSMLLMTYFAFSGLMTLCEFLSSTIMLCGAYFLTHNKMSIGWTLALISHLLAAYLGYQKDQNFFADFQIASAMIAFVGIIQNKK